MDLLSLQQHFNCKNGIAIVAVMSSSGWGGLWPDPSVLSVELSTVETSLTFINFITAERNGCRGPPQRYM